MDILLALTYLLTHSLTCETVSGLVSYRSCCFLWVTSGFHKRSS